jgi:hypothetical protein
MAAILTVSASQAPDQWKLFTAPDGCFSVKFPEEPQSVRGKWDVYIARAGEVGFAVRVEPVHPQFAHSSPEVFYDHFQRAESSRRDLLSSRPAKLGMLLGREFIVKGQGQKGHALLTFRLYRKAERLFVLTVYDNADNPSVRETSMFLDSFKITE